jgi:transposase
VKQHAPHAVAQIVSQITTLKNCVRGILKTFGRVLPKGLRSQFSARVRAVIDGPPIRKRQGISPDPSMSQGIHQVIFSGAHYGIEPV